MSSSKKRVIKLKQKVKEPFFQEDLGIEGGETLKQHLIEEHPKDAIDLFQKKYTFSLECQAMFGLLDVHNIKRSETHQVLLQLLVDSLKQKIGNFGKEDLRQIDQLLELTFPFIEFPELSELPLALLDLHTEIPEAYLAKLAADETLYQQCSLQVKRQVWLRHENLFQEYLFPIIHLYISESMVEDSGCELLRKESRGIPPVKRRKQNTALRQIMDAVGAQVDLYENVAQLLCRMYGNTGRLEFCQLRVDIVMCAHDCQNDAIFSQDRIHKLCWCLDACGRDDVIEERRIHELQQVFDGMGEEDAVIGELGMAVIAPHTATTLVRNVYRFLSEVVDKECQPKDHNSLRYITQLFSLGLKSRDMIRMKQGYVPKLNRDTVLVFYPMMAGMILDQITRGFVAEEEEKAVGDIPAEPLPAGLADRISSDPLARRVTMYHALLRADVGDATALEPLLQLFSTLPVSILAHEMPFVKALAAVLINMADKAALSRIWVCVFDDFIIKFCSKDINFHIQAVRVLAQMKMPLPQPLLLKYLAKTVSNGHVGEVDDSEAEPLRQALILLYSSTIDTFELTFADARFLYEYIGRPSEGELIDI
eukprot:GCRY01003534.1.p1 GENE.GCRY01003534.1~~GCRY01003534.1.p1  ORF type:complete len:593 (+),score=177.56 GCRY01003534.1:238-2016(+)